jgi:hypothetical protein
MTLKLGTELSREDQAYVLRAYVHRFTGDHKPGWARKARPDGSAYPVQFKDDQDWLAHTEFYVKKNGSIDHRHDNCFSSPTWPNNPELRK